MSGPCGRRASGASLVAVGLALAWFGGSVVADDAPWPAWRGPDNNGVVTDADPPTRWSASENIVWRATLPGPAGATPVVTADRIILTSVSDADLIVSAYATEDGRELWQHKAGENGKRARGDEGNAASPSPVTDGKHVWVFFGSGDLLCLDLEGEVRWAFNVQERFGQIDIQFGMSSSPVLHDGRLYLQLIHGDGDATTREARVVCLDGASSKTIWAVERPSDAIQENEHSYASPIIYQAEGETPYLITHGADYTIGHRLEDGAEIWRIGGLNPKTNYNPYLRLVASPATAGGLIVIPTAKGGPVFAIRGDKTGDLTGDEAAIVWTMPRDTPDVPSPLIYDGIVYLCRENGVLIATDAKTGEVLYQKRTTSDRHRASPVGVAGRVYTTSRGGVVTVTQAGREGTELARNEIGEPTSASPIVIGKRLYLRTFDALYAIEDGAK